MKTLVDRCTFWIIIEILTLASTALPFSPMDPPISDEALGMASHFMESGSYDEAITEYKRFIFFNPESEHTDYVLYKMGLAYRSEYRWQAAVDAIKGSISAAKDPRIANERRMTLATTLIASGNYSLGRLELMKLSESSIDPPLHLKSLFFCGISALYMHDWQGAMKDFNTFYSIQDKSTIKRGREIQLVLEKAQGSHKSVRLAKILSAIIPGLGQIYAEAWRDGVNALVLNGLAIGFLASAIHKKDYGNALLISSVWNRYYMGNIYRAEIDAKKHNEFVDRQNTFKILELVRSDEPI